MLKHAVIILVTIGCATLAAQSEAAAKFYRYTNTDGLEEVSHTIPNDRVPHGYEVLDSDMRVIERVAPQLTPDEIVVRNIRQREEAVCLASKKRVQALYESEQDIADAEKQALDSLVTRINNAQANLAQLRNQHRELEEDAARMDRSGQSLSSILLSNLDRAKAQIDNLEKEITQRNLEKEETRIQHAVDLEVFQQPPCLVASTAEARVQS